MTRKARGEAAAPDFEKSLQELEALIAKLSAATCRWPNPWRCSNRASR